jgi:translation elongation factor EF-1alpha
MRESRFDRGEAVMAEQLVGSVTHWYGEIEVAGVEVTDTIEVGDTLHFTGHTTDFTHEVTSMQIEHDDVETAGPGDSIGIKVPNRVRVGDEVYKTD